MAYSERQLEDIKERVDLPALIGRRVTLKKSGKDYSGLCPFHGERTPSFYVVPAKQMWHCFGCGESGDVFKFFMKLDGLGFGEAIRHVAQESGLILEDEKLDPEEARRRAHIDDLAALMERAVRFYEQKLWHASASAVREYVEKRGVTAETARRFHVGFGGAGMDDLARALEKANAPLSLAIEAGLCIRGKSGRAFDRFHGRLITPIRIPRPPDGRSIALGGRYLEGITDARGRTRDKKPAKYINSPESALYQKGHVLFGMDLARDAIRREERAVIVEGYFDVIGLHQAGLPLAVASCGTSLTPAHLDLLTRIAAREIIFLFDGDAAGLRAAARAAEMCARAQVPAKVATLPDGLDPDDFARQRGLDGLKGLLERARPVIEVLIDHALNELGPTAGVEERVRAVQDVREIVLAAPEGLARELYFAQIAERLRVSDSVVKEAVLHPPVRERRPPKEDPDVIAPPEPGRPPPAPRPAAQGPGKPAAAAQIVARQTLDCERQIAVAVLRFPALVEDVQRGGVIGEFEHPALKTTVERVIKAIEAKEAVDGAHLIAEVPDVRLREQLSKDVTQDDSTLEDTRKHLDRVMKKMLHKIRQALAKAAWLTARNAQEAARKAS